MAKDNRGSIVYQMRHAPIFAVLETERRKQNRDTESANKKGLPPPRFSNRVPTLDTLNQYRHDAIAFAVWVRDRYGCIDEAKDHIQDYVDDLMAAGKSESSVHTYLAAVCRAYGDRMDKYDKPTRHAARFKQGRGRKAAEVRADRAPDRSPRLHAFAGMVGIRREEYLHLRGNDLAQDESGYWCVVVRRGKGGKYQLQRIPEQYLNQVKSYFDGSSEFVFTKAELTNKLQLHRLRHQLAWERYQYYVHRLGSKPSYRNQLTEEVKRRWGRYANKRWDPSAVQGRYCLRGKNRELAVAAGFPTSYDRLALMAVSMFHLSHWRLDVTVASYILAVARDRLLRV